MSIFKVIKKTSPSTSEEIKISLKKFRQKDLKIDISNLNLIDATKTALMFSTKLFTQFPDKTVKWIVKDVETKKIISNLILKNMKVEIKNCTVADRVYAIR